ncbi:MAG TPA: hypothetical protein VG992_01025 [Candidatus Saccharimonadales bacterium]|nr:hypothetical protein [Candidatus Saccharimonadales bacterium]
MEDRVDQVTREEIVPQTTSTTPIRQIHQTTVTSEAPGTLAARVIWYIAGVLLVLLALRFVLALLGANPANGFANFIYSVSHPFVAPFFSLFSYNLRYGVSRFEIYTLVAMAVYALIAWGLARLVTLNHHTHSHAY